MGIQTFSEDWLRRMGRDLGDEADADFAEMVDRLEAGDDLGDLGPEAGPLSDTEL